MSGHADDAWNAEVRNETPEQRLDRNFSEMLQEVRVAQTGVQILFAFLLTVVFFAGFHVLHGAGLAVYAGTVVSSALATGFLIAPVACHRVLFRHRAKDRLVLGSHRLTLAGLALLGVSVIGSLVLVLEVALGWTWALVVSGGVAVVFVLPWVVLPLTLRGHAVPRAR